MGQRWKQIKRASGEMPAWEENLAGAKFPCDKLWYRECRAGLIL